MKNFKIAVATLLIATLSIAVSSFTVKSYSKRAFAVQCYELINVNINTAALNAGNSTAVNNFNNVNNWQPIVNVMCAAPNLICVICFDPGTTGYTLQDALNEIASAIIAGNYSYAHGSQFTSPTKPTVTITVYERP